MFTRVNLDSITGVKVYAAIALFFYQGCAVGISQKLLNLDDIFYRQMQTMPVVVDTEDLLNNRNLPKSMGRQLLVNRLDETSSRSKEIINSSLYTRYRNDNSISSIPSCEQGHLIGRHLLGVVCEECRTPVVAKHETPIHSILWFKTPKGIESLINPDILTMLIARFRRQSFDTIRWLCDLSYAPAVQKPKPIVTLEEILNNAGIQRGYNSFVKNFDTIMDILFERPNLRPQNMPRDYLRELIIQDRDKVFCTHLPLPHKLLMVVEETNFFTYHDKEMRPAIDALWTMAGIDSDVINLKPRQREARVVRALWLLTEYHKGALSSVYMQKEGMFRGQLYGFRSIFSFRTVISSITVPHRYDEIHIPWGVAITVLRFHIVNKLVKLGWAPKEIDQFLIEHTLKYNPLLDEIFNELIEATPDGLGIPCMAVRNPSLKRGSAQMFYITKVKTSLEDITTSLSILVTKPFNADNSFKHIYV